MRPPPSVHRQMDAAVIHLAAAKKALELAAVELPDLEADAATRLASEVHYSLRRAKNLRQFFRVLAPSDA